MTYLRDLKYRAKLDMPLDLKFDYDVCTSKLENFNQTAVDGLREWCTSLDASKYVPFDISDSQLVLFLNACDFNLERSKNCLLRYYECRRNAPEFFDNRLLKEESIKHALEVLEFSYLPYQSKEGYDVIFHRLKDTEPSKYVFEVGVKLLFMCVDACQYNRGPQRGVIFLFDMQGVKLGHLTRLSLWSLRKYFQYVQEGMPVKMREIHVLNTEPILDKLMLIIRPFMDRKLYDMIKFHNKNEDLESFYENVIPRSALPKDFGGDLASCEELHKICIQHLAAVEPHFIAEEAQRKDALAGKKRETGFDNLDID